MALRVALLGFSKATERTLLKHLPKLAPNTLRLSLVGSDHAQKEKLKALASSFDLDTSFLDANTSVQSVLQDPSVDTVFLSDFLQDHTARFEITKEALSRSKNVVLESPLLGSSRNGLSSLEALSASSGAIIIESLPHLHQPFFKEKIMSSINSSSIGDLRYVSFNTSSDPLDLYHSIDLINRASASFFLIPAVSQSLQHQSNTPVSRSHVLVLRDHTGQRRPIPLFINTSTSSGPSSALFFGTKTQVTIKDPFLGQDTPQSVSFTGKNGETQTILSQDPPHIGFENHLNHLLQCLKDRSIPSSSPQNPRSLLSNTILANHIEKTAQSPSSSLHHFVHDVTPLPFRSLFPLPSNDVPVHKRDDQKRSVLQGEPLLDLSLHEAHERRQNEDTNENVKRWESLAEVDLELFGESKSFVSTLMNLFSAYYHNNQPQKAIETAKRITDIADRLPAERDIQSFAADVLTHAALLSNKQGDHTNSIQLILQSLKKQVDLFGADSKEAANALINTAFIHRESGIFDKALGFIDKAISITKNMAGDKKLYADTIRFKGHLLHLRGDHKIGESYVDRALKIYYERPNENIQSIEASHSVLVQIYKVLGEKEKLLVSLQAIVHIFLSKPPTNHLQFFNTAFDLSFDFLTLREFSLALYLAKHALTTAGPSAVGPEVRAQKLIECAFGCSQQQSPTEEGTFFDLALSSFSALFLPDQSPQQTQRLAEELLLFSLYTYSPIGCADAQGTEAFQNALESLERSLRSPSSSSSEFLSLFRVCLASQERPSEKPIPDLSCK